MFLKLLLSEIEPQVLLPSHADARSHHFKHYFLSWNVNAVGDLSHNVSVFRVHQLPRIVRHFVQSWVNVIQASVDELVVVWVWIRKPNLEKAVDLVLSEIVWIVSETKLDEEISADLGECLGLRRSSLVKDSVFILHVDSAHNNVLELFLVFVLASCRVFQPPLHESNVID